MDDEVREPVTGASTAGYAIAAEDDNEKLNERFLFVGLHTWGWATSEPVMRLSWRDEL